MCGVSVDDCKELVIDLDVPERHAAVQRLEWASLYQHNRRHRAAPHKSLHRWLR